MIHKVTPTYCKVMDIVVKFNHDQMSLREFINSISALKQRSAKLQQPTAKVIKPSKRMDAIAAAIKVWGDRWCIDKTMQYVLRRRIKQLLQQHQ